MQYLCIGALVGLLIEDKLLYSSYFALYFFLLFLSLAILFLLDRKRGLLKRMIVPCLLVSLSVSFFIVRGQFIQKEEGAPIALYQKQELVFTVEDKKEENVYTRYEVSFPFREEKYKAYLRLDSYPKYELGEKVKGNLALDAKEEVIIADSGRTSFDYADYLRDKVIVGVYSFPKLERTGEKGESFALALASKKHYFIEKIKGLMRSPEGDLVSATLFGSEALTKEQNELYRKAGVSHIVALSGFNITIIIAFLSVVLFFLPFWIRFFLSIFLISLYLLLVGVSGSLLRATLMAGISLLALARGNVANGKRVLLLSTLLLALFFPSEFVNDVSLQLSLLAMYGVLFVYPAFFEQGASKKKGVYRLCYELFFITVAVTILITPYTAMVFHTAALYGTIATVLVTPFVPLITILGIIVLLIPVSFSFLLAPLSFILFAFAFIVIGLAEFFSKLPLALTSFSVTATFCTMYYAGMILLVAFLEKKKEMDATEGLLKDKERNDGVIEGVIRF